MTAAIETEGLTRTYGHREVVSDLTFWVEWGRVTAFLGPNGAGKTTTMRMMLGLVEPSRGTTRIAGHPYRRLPSPGTTVGAVLDGQHFHPLRTARNHLLILATLGGVSPSRVDKVLDVVELGSAAEERVGGFSLGMRQRLALAAALLGDPSVLVLDEPANGLDPAGVRWLRSLLRTLAAEGRAVFVSSHLLDEVTHVADHVVVIKEGRLVVATELRQLLETQAAVRVRTPQPEQLRNLVTPAGGSADLVGHEELVVKGISAEQLGLMAAQGGIPVTGLAMDDLPLEDVFLELTTQGGTT